MRKTTLGLLLLSCLVLTGCFGRRAALAASGASIWEAAHAIDHGGDVEACIKIIKVQSAAIIQISGHTYQKAGVE